MKPQTLRILNAVALSGTATTRKKFSLKEAIFASLHFVWTGTPTATITLWASNKSEPDDTADTDWVDITANYTITSPAGSASKAMLNLPQIGYANFMLKIVNASGTGTLSVWLHGKAPRS